MNPELAALIELQKMMARFDELRERAQELPQLIETCQGEHRQVIEQHEAVVQRSKQTQVDLHGAEVDLKAGEEEWAKKQIKLHEVKTNVEYKAAQNEIAALKQKKSDAETRILELFEAVEAVKAEVVDSEEQLQKDKQEYATKLKVLEDELAEVQGELERFESKVSEKRSGMKPQTVSRFDRIYQRNLRNAVVPSNNGNCGYCQISLAPHRIQIAKEAREIIICDHCGSILYWERESEQAPA